MEPDVHLPPVPVIERVARIGKRTLALRSYDGQWFVRCQNRTYDSGWHPVTPAQAERWKEELE